MKFIISTSLLVQRRTQIDFKLAYYMLQSGTLASTPRDSSNFIIIITSALTSNVIHIAIMSPITIIGVILSAVVLFVPEGMAIAVVRYLINSKVLSKAEG